MSILAFIGWVLVGIIATAVLVTFWDEIRSWLNNVATDAVERTLGYGARERMHRAVCKIDRIVNKIKNSTVIYTKKSELDSIYDKTTLVSEASLYEIDDNVINEIKNKGMLVQEFEYKK